MRICMPLGSFLIVLSCCVSLANGQARGITVEPRRDAASHDRPELIVDAEGFACGIQRLAFSPDGRWLAVAAGQEVRVWDLRDGQIVATLRGQTAGGSMGECEDLAFSPDGSSLVVGVYTATGEGGIRVYRVPDFRGDFVALSGLQGPVDRLSFSRDGHYLAVATASGSDEGGILIWDWPKREICARVNGQLTFTHISGERVALGEFGFFTEAPALVAETESIDQPAQVHTWVPSSQKGWKRSAEAEPPPAQKAPAAPPAPPIPPAPRAAPSPEARSHIPPDPNLLALADDLRNAAAADSAPAETEQRGWRLLNPQFGEHPPEEVQLALWRLGAPNWFRLPYSTDAHCSHERLQPRDFRLDQRLLLGGGHGVQNQADYYWVGLWSLDDGNPKVVYDQHRFWITAVALNHDCSMAASGDLLGDVHVWNTGSGLQQYYFRGKGRAVWNVGFDPSGRKLAFGRKPYGKDEWQHNHYAALEQVFDLERRKLMAVDDQVYTQPVTQLGELSLTLVEQDSGVHVKDCLLTVRNSERQLSSWPMPGSPYCFTFLSSSHPGFSRPIAIGDPVMGPLCLDLPPDLSVAWSKRTDSVRRQFVTGIGRSEGRSATVLAESVDGRFLAIGFTDGVVRVYSLTKFERWGDMGLATEGIDPVTHLVVPVAAMEPESQAPPARIDPHMAGTAAPVLAPASPPPKPPEMSELLRKAGLRLGDRILKMDGQTIDELLESFNNNPLDLLRRYKANQRMVVEFQRGTEMLRGEVVLPAVADIVEPLLNLFITADGEWVVWTPQGYYDASPGADRLLGWRVNQGWSKAAAYYPIHQFRKRFYRPDVIDMVLEKADVAEGIAAASGGVLPPPALIDPPNAAVLQRIKPPRVRILAPKDGQTSVSDQITLRAEVVAENDLPIRAIRVAINGVPIENQDFDRDQFSGQRQILLVQPLRLHQRRNLISVSASNQESFSEAERVTVHCSAATVPQSKPKLYQLVVGVSRYKNPDFNLKFARKDAEAVIAAWKQQEGVFYDRVEAKALLDEDATATNVRRGMDWLVSSVTRNDLAMIFFSSHGVQDPRRNYYLATHELDPEQLRSTGVSSAEIQRLCEELPCKVLMFIDTCHGGGATGTKALDQDPWRELVAEGVGPVVFASCLPREKSREDERWQHGAFTKALLDSLANPATDRNRDGYLSITELDGHVVARVKELTNGQQHAVMQKPLNLPDFNLAKARPAMPDEKTPSESPQ